MIKKSLEPRLTPTLLLRPLAVGLALTLLSTAFACAPTEKPASAGGALQIVTTTGMIADAARRIAGEHAEVVALMGPGIDPHLYKATESDVRKLSDADLILYQGLFLEGKMGDILGKLSSSRPVLAVGEVIDESVLMQPPAYEGQFDPHVWFDVGLWAEILLPITDALSELRPEHAESFRANAAAFAEQLQAMDQWVDESIATIPEEQRVLVTAHDAFGYFGRRYGLEVVGLQGLSTLAEAGLKDVDRVVDIVTSRQIPAMFVESSVPRRSIEALQASCREAGWEVAIGGELFSDAMGAAGTREGTYPGMVEHNVTTLVTALGGRLDSPFPGNEEGSS
ncbi:MAG: zinc ABC transporter substrate-binding protein [Acidobacteriota bacterium]